MGKYFTTGRDGCEAPPPQKKGSTIMYEKMMPRRLKALIEHVVDPLR